MKQKGFTLVEVLAVIIILGIVVTIVYPIVVSTIKSSEIKAYNSQIEIIKKAAKVYALEKESGPVTERVLPSLEEGKTSYVSIKDLIDTGYISDEELQDEDNVDLKNGILKNPKEDLSCTQVKITYESNQYTYKVVDDKDTECIALTD